MFYKEVAYGAYSGPSDILHYLEQLLTTSGFVICPGLKEYPKQLGFKTKHLVEWGPPFCRISSDNCTMWHLPHNLAESSLFQCCKACKQLQHDIKQLVQRADETTEVQKRSRTLPSSKYPISKLSPDSQKKRIASVMVERKYLISKINRLQKFDCTVSDKQNDELMQLVEAVNSTHSKVIEELIEEGNRQLGENNLLHDSWRQDVTERLNFDSTQQKSC